MHKERTGARPARAPGTRPLLRRLLWAAARLQAGKPLRAVDVAREFEVSERTAYRDFDVLRDDWRLPVAFDRSKGTFRLTAPAAFVPPVTLSRGEVAAVFFAERVVAQYRGTPFEADLRSAFRKLAELLPEEVSVSPVELDAALSLDPGPVHVPDVAVFSEVLAALQARRVVVVRYRSLSSGRTTERALHPYHVFNHRGDWYVAAWDETREAVRDFALHRMRRAVVTTARYEVAEGFDARAYLSEAFGIEKGGRPVEVAIRFGARQARWIRERRWHVTARIQDRLDGGCVLRFRASGQGEVARWVLQFGGEAEVLSPASLRRQVSDELARAAASYGRSGSRSRSRPRARRPATQVFDR